MVRRRRIKSKEQKRESGWRALGARRENLNLKEEKKEQSSERKRESNTLREILRSIFEQRITQIACVWA